MARLKGPISARKQWSADDVAKARELKGRGFTWKAAARFLDLPVDGLYQHVGTARRRNRQTFETWAHDVLRMRALARQGITLEELARMYVVPWPEAEELFSALGVTAE